MKKLHLICNAHLDPVWQWDWEEGIGAAISTFWQAAEFCKEYDYIFCHNEVILYEWIEKYDKPLFEEIKRQVANGKWHIMGGWYLQPDCNIPSGESFVREIKLGRKYFQDKFGVRPSTAINFDSFGHTIGLVQILKKCGYDSYLICRPMPELVELPDKEFMWIGLDGSKIKVSRTEDPMLYATWPGYALEQIKAKAARYEDRDIGVALWGVGNHGGNPSRKDLADVAGYIEENRGSIEVVHSTPEAYFAEIEPTVEFNKSLNPCLIGAYTSMNSIKQKHIQLENKLFTTEKLCALAQWKGVYEKNECAFETAEKALACIEFHDIASGTCTHEGEESGLRKADYALELLQEEWNKAFFALTGMEERAKEGEYPFFVFNPQPYEREVVLEMEYLMVNGLTSDERQYSVTVRQNGKVVPSQRIKEISNFNFDRRMRIAVKCSLPPFEIARLDLTAEITPKEKEPIQPENEIVYEDTCKKIRISKKTGLMESCIINGKELLTGGAFEPIMYEDNPDPWGWYMETIGKSPKPFALSDCKSGVFRGMENVKVVEDGAVLTQVESFFDLEKSSVRISYKIYKDLPYIDVDVNAYWNEKERALKVKVPTALNGSFFGQVPFGQEIFEKNGKEVPMQRFSAISDGENAFAIYNNCTYGFVHDGSAWYATLLRGAAYCAHPIEDRPIIEKNIFIPHIEQGKHVFRFRMAYDKKIELENNAQNFVNTPTVLNFFPHGNGRDITPFVVLDNPAISLVACYEENGHYVLRLLNNNAEVNDACLAIGGEKHPLHFGKFEARTYEYANGVLTEKLVWY